MPTTVVRGRTETTAAIGGRQRDWPWRRPMGLQQWLGDTPLSDFLSGQFLKVPFSGPCHASDDRQLGDWAMLERILRSEDADTLIVRDGRRYSGDDAAEDFDAHHLIQQGYTILVRHAERHDARLQKLADQFAAELRGPVNVHIYATPGGRFGFDWHYDAEDVFILQTAGEKEYSLRKNTVNPWPLAEAIPEDLRYPREIMPLMRCLLKAGDWLYLPNGYWHKADAVGDSTAISLAIGIMSPAAIRVWDALRAELIDSLLWRQRLPIAECPQLNDGQMSSLMQLLKEDICRRLDDKRTVEQLLEHLQPQRTRDQA